MWYDINKKAVHMFQRPLSTSSAETLIVATVAVVLCGVLWWRILSKKMLKGQVHDLIGDVGQHCWCVLFRWRQKFSYRVHTPEVSHKTDRWYGFRRSSVVLLLTTLDGCFYTWSDVVGNVQVLIWWSGRCKTFHNPHNWFYTRRFFVLVVVCPWCCRANLPN